MSKSLEIGRGGRIVVLRRWQRFKCAQRRASAAQDEIADRPSLDLGNFRHDRLTGADTRSELFVRRLEPRRDIDGVAIGGVIEEAAAAEIPDNRRAGMNSDPRHTDADPIALPRLSEDLRELI